MTPYRSLSLAVALFASFACDSNTQDQVRDPVPVQQDALAKAKPDLDIDCGTLLERTQAACRASLFDGVHDSGCAEGVLALENTANQRQGTGFQVEGNKLDDQSVVDAMCRRFVKTVDERAAKGEKAAGKIGPECRKRAEAFDAECIATLTLDGAATPECKMSLQLINVACPDWAL